jgi:response regulator RpfG family c-di-GMP phosphodiesterase
VKTHATKGAEILMSVNFKAMGPIAAMVSHHHEAFSGGGYPDGLKGEAIPLGARIIALAESFDSMVSERRYKRARNMLDALKELRRCSGTQFDPKVVEAFFYAVRLHPD